MTQHAGLSLARWADFSRDQHVLMIANEMNRAGKLVQVEDAERRKRGYARILQLVDLTVAVDPDRSFRRELLRWRELVAELYLADAPRPEVHAALLRCLLQMTPAAARQLPYLLGAGFPGPEETRLSGRGTAPPRPDTGRSRRDGPAEDGR